MIFQAQIKNGGMRWWKQFHFFWDFFWAIMWNWKRDHSHRRWSWQRDSTCTSKWKKIIRRPETLKRQRTKKLRNEGKAYLDRKWKLHQTRKLREYNHECRNNCNTNFTEENWQIIFNDFWKLGSWNLRIYHDFFKSLPHQDKPITITKNVVAQPNENTEGSAEDKEYDNMYFSDRRLK